MDIDTFTKKNYLNDFSEERLNALFDWEAVAYLSDNPVEHQRILWLSKFLTGRVNDAIEEIKELDSRQQWATFDTWITVTKDLTALRSITRHIIYHLL